jgi:hypothetical protein
MFAGLRTLVLTTICFNDESSKRSLSFVLPIPSRRFAIARRAFSACSDTRHQSGMRRPETAIEEGPRWDDDPRSQSVHKSSTALESDMAHIFGFERSQLLLLPETVDDYVGADNPVRFIDVFVDELDLAAAGFVRASRPVAGLPGLFCDIVFIFSVTPFLYFR